LLIEFMGTRDRYKPAEASYIRKVWKAKAPALVTRRLFLRRFHDVCSGLGMPEDSTLRVHHATLGAIATADDAWVDLQISDNGMGFAPEEAAALKPFTPGRRNKTKRNSTGYGLPNAMRNIGAHGGTVHVSSEMNRGTTVTVRLPLRDAGAPEMGETP
jgi:hypothetical protein